MESFSPFGGSPLRSHLPVTTTTDPMGSPLPYTTTNPMASLQNNPDMMAVIQTLIDNSATTRNADGVSAMAAMQLNQHQSATATDARKRKKAEEKPYPNATEKYGVPVNFGLPNSRLFTINGVRATYTQCKNSQPFAREKIRKVWYVFATSNNLQRARELRDDEQDITVEDCTKFLGDFQKWQVIFFDNLPSYNCFQIDTNIFAKLHHSQLRQLPKMRVQCDDENGPRSCNKRTT